MKARPNIPIVNIKEFAKLVSDVCKSDRWALIGVSGEQGEGKSCFSDKLTRNVSEINNRHFDYSTNMTYQRKALKEMIDGKNRLKEYSAVLADELVSMFFSRNWFDSEQIDGIELLNKCRDRHLAVVGNIPVLWHLDIAFLPLVRFWIHIHERGRAWAFEKSRNPFAKDKWYQKENEKLFNKHKHPYHCKGFLCEIHFNDWSKEEKREYYKARNTMRVGTEGQREKRVEKYTDLKLQRDELIKFSLDYSKRVAKAIKDATELTKQNEVLEILNPINRPLQHKEIADVLGVSSTLIGYVTRGER